MRAAKKRNVQKRQCIEMVYIMLVLIYTTKIKRAPFKEQNAQRMPSKHQETEKAGSSKWHRIIDMCKWEGRVYMSKQSKKRRRQQDKCHLLLDYLSERKSVMLWLQQDMLWDQKCRHVPFAPICSKTRHNRLHVKFVKAYQCIRKRSESDQSRLVIEETFQCLQRDGLHQEFIQSTCFSLTPWSFGAQRS